MGDAELGPDVLLVMSAIAAELGVDVEQLPPGIAGVLHAFGAARYGEGARDFLWSKRKGSTNRAFPAPVLAPVPHDERETPVTGPYGRRRRDRD